MEHQQQKDKKETEIKVEKNVTEKKEDKKSDELQNLRNKIEELQKKNEELLDRLKRLQAEFDNYKKWFEKEKVEFIKFANGDLLSRLLPVLDSFDLAMKHNNDKEKFLQGIKMIYAQLHSILQSAGLEPIKTEGNKFDPYRHEVLMKEASDKEEGSILEEFQKGYTLHDKVLRHSKVKISGK